MSNSSNELFGRRRDRQLIATLGYLARGLPVYDVVFARDGSFTVCDA